MMFRFLLFTKCLMFFLFCSVHASQLSILNQNELHLDLPECETIDNGKFSSSFLQEVIQSCYVSIFSAQQKLKNKESILVDVRSQREYENVHIPDSLNIPPYLIKHKPFLKDKPILLINRGDKTVQLTQLCQSLRQQGYQISIVKGGLNGWQRIAGNLNGSLEAIRQIDEMTPEIFLQELKHTGTLVVKLLNNHHQTVSPLLEIHPDILQVPHNTPFNELVDRLNNSLKEKPIKTRVLLFDEQGDSYTTLKTRLKQMLSADLFYLKGGESAFKKYQQNLQTMLNRKDRPPIPSFQCRG